MIIAWYLLIVIKQQQSYYNKITRKNYNDATAHPIFAMSCKLS